MKRLTHAGIVAVVMLLAASGCASNHDVERANQTATRYWTEKALPGRAIEVQVLATTKVEDGKYRVRALVDGQQRIGHFNAESGSFEEGYTSPRKPRAARND